MDSSISAHLVYLLCDEVMCLASDQSRVILHSCHMSHPSQGYLHITRDFVEIKQPHKNGSLMTAMKYTFYRKSSEYSCSDNADHFMPVDNFASPLYKTHLYLQ